MTITGGSALPKDDIERMMREAEQYADEDRQRKEAAEARNMAEGLVYQTEKFLADNADKLPEDARSNVDGPLADLKKALEGDDIEAIRTGTETLATASQALGTAMYANAAAEGADPTGFDGGRRRRRLGGRRVRHRRRRGRGRRGRRRGLDRGRQAVTEPVEGGPVFRDRRRIDPETYEVREPRPDGAPGPGATASVTRARRSRRVERRAGLGPARRRAGRADVGPPAAVRRIHQLPPQGRARPRRRTRDGRGLGAGRAAPGARRHRPGPPARRARRRLQVRRRGARAGGRAARPRGVRRRGGAVRPRRARGAHRRSDRPSRGSRWCSRSSSRATASPAASYALPGWSSPSPPPTVPPEGGSTL